MAERIFGGIKHRKFSEQGHLNVGDRYRLAVSRTNNAGTKNALAAANITRTTGEVICRSPPEYHFPVGIGIWCGVSLFGVAILLGMYRVLLFNFWGRLFRRTTPNQPQCQLERKHACSACAEV